MNNKKIIEKVYVYDKKNNDIKGYIPIYIKDLNWIDDNFERRGDT